MKLPWTKKKDLEFVDASRSIYMHFPVQLAKDVKPRPYYEQKDLKKYNNNAILYNQDVKKYNTLIEQ